MAHRQHDDHHTHLTTRRAMAAAALFCCIFAALPAESAPALFGARETRSENLRPFQKWLGALERYVGERIASDNPCTPGGLEKCALQTWQGFLETLRHLDRRSQVEAVNRFINDHPYITDPVNWGVDDYWETPREFLERNGDCEDYAIAKFLSLRLLGFDNDTLRIVVLKDLNLQIYHAVLAVYLDGDILTLDNQIKTVVSSERIRHYRPIYSINERFWWLHRQ